MDLERIYKNVSLNDLHCLKPLKKRGKKKEMKQRMEQIIREGLHDNKERLIDIFDDMSYDYELQDNHELIVKEVIAEYLDEERTWARYTDTDILFVIVKEAAKIFPTLYHNFGQYSRPSDTLDDLEERYPKFVRGEEKGDSTVVYINIDSSDCIDRDPFPVEIFNGEPKERIKIRDYICDRLDEMKRFTVIRDKKTEGGLHGILIHNFKWQFRYPPGFFN
jgi:hypothetical protein